MRFFRNYFLWILVVIISSCAANRNSTSSANNSIEGKYSHLLGVSTSTISNKKLYSFIDEWYGVPYKYAGKSKSGIDCSGFIVILYKEVFGKEITGSSASICNQCNKISKDELREGDLVFFSIRSPSDKIDSKDPPAGRAGISHIGIYLQNNKFVHATTKAGVMIDDLNEQYYLKYFESAGRIR